MTCEMQKLAILSFVVLENKSTSKKEINLYNKQCTYHFYESKCKNVVTTHFGMCYETNIYKYSHNIA